MKHTIAALTAICSVACLTCAPRAEANSQKSIRADLPCPYGGINAGAWVPASPSSLNPNPGLLVGNTTTPIAASVFLAAGPNLPSDTDDNGLALASTGTGQFDWYVNPIPAASNCSDPSFNGGDMPVEQVIQFSLASGTYNLGDGSTLSVAAGDTEVEFNYASTLSGTAGVASFTIGGVTYTSIGASLPTGTANDFLLIKAASCSALWAWTRPTTPPFWPRFPTDGPVPAAGAPSPRPRSIPPRQRPLSLC